MLSQPVMTGPTVPFVLVDVFTGEPLAGNPLAVVPGADHLDVETMQRVAREFNQSETTFMGVAAGRLRV